MTDNDAGYVRKLIDDGVLRGDVLELGAGYGGETCREMIVGSGMRYFASDMTPSPGVDFVLDFEKDDVAGAMPAGTRFDGILVLNVLEHAFEPIRILDNCARLLKPSGALVVIAPAAWTLHSYPVDCYRFLPDWFDRYAETRGMTIDADRFEYVGYGPVRRFADPEGRYALPPPTKSAFRYWRSRVVHKLFDTFGRGMVSPGNLGIGAVMRIGPGPKPAGDD